MPNSIQNIVIKKEVFYSGRALQECINAYFTYIDGEYEVMMVAPKLKGATEQVEEKVWLREPEPPTLTGLAWYLGFKSREEFEKYETTGRYGGRLKRARLRIEAAYEKKLHGSSSTGAIFALKAMGWGDRTDQLSLLGGTIRIEVIQAELHPAETESTVIL